MSCASNGDHPLVASGRPMAVLTEDMKRVVREQRLGFHATVCEDGSPNLSPKGTTAVWDDGHLFFAHIRSSRTVSNIRRGSAVEINVVDPFERKGYRFKGPAVVHEPGSDGFTKGIERLRQEGYTTPPDRIRAIVVIEVQQAHEVTSPAYDDGTKNETEVRRAWQDHFARVHRRNSS